MGREPHGRVSPCRTSGFAPTESLRADQKRTKHTDQKSTSKKVKGLFVSSSRSAKPLYVGSNPTRASKLFNSNGLGSTSRLRTLAVLALRRTKGGPPNPIISIRTVLLPFESDLSVVDLSPHATCHGQWSQKSEFEKRLLIRRRSCNRTRWPVSFPDSRLFGHLPKT